MVLKTHRRFAQRGTGLLVTTLAALPVPALAQEDSADILVTARRVEERLQDVPISITVFNQQQLSNRNIVSAGELATYTPSLSSNGRWGAESTSFAIRGFVQEGPTTPSVGTYFADVTAPRANGGTTAGNGAGVGAFFDLASVQILKGPQGTLFGRNTTGGAILLTPQRPTDRLEGYVEGSLGNYDMRRMQAVLNIPVLDTLRIRLGVDRQTRSGYLHNVSAIGPRDFGDVDYLSARASVVADLTPDLENYLILSYSRSDTNGSFPKVSLVDPANPAVVGFAMAGGLGAQIASTSGDYYDVSNGHPNPFLAIEQWQIINTTTWRASDHLTIRNIASYAEFRQAVAVNNNGDNVRANFAAVSLNPEPGSDNISQSTFTEELQVQGRTGDDSLTYQAGGYLELSEPVGGMQESRSSIFATCADIFRPVTCAPGSNQLSLSRSEYHFRNLALYGQGNYRITDRLTFTAGIRYTSDISSGLGNSLRVTFPRPTFVPLYGCAQPNGLVTGPIPNDAQDASAAIQNDPGLCGYSRRITSARPTWLLGIDFAPVKSVLIYGKYARGYRQGSLNVSSYGLETWGPERVDTYEIGTKTRFGGVVRGTLNVAAFYNDFSNQQLLAQPIQCLENDVRSRSAGVLVDSRGRSLANCTFAPSPAQGIANAGKSTIKGVEVTASILLFHGLTLDLGYSHLATKLDTVAKPAPPLGFKDVLVPSAGSVLPLTPRNKYAISASYGLPVPDDVGRISVGATFTHQDSVLGQPSSAPGLRFLPPQDNLNLNLNWNSVAGGPVDLALFATNVTKQRYPVFTTGGYENYGFDSLLLNQPQMYGARLKYRFGA